MGSRSPRAWGWTAQGCQRVTALREIPTRVGMDRRLPCCGRSASRDPHARGDGPRPSCGTPSPQRRSPRAWGWTGTPQAARGAQGEIPTRVGMDRSDATTRQPRLGDPHARGDGPTSHMNCAVARSGDPHARGDGPADERRSSISTTRSPRAWGWTARAPCARAPALEIPTRVGMDRRSARASRSTSRDPHARGDGPKDRLAELLYEGRSPRAWGWTDGDRRAGGGRHEIPTRVGMDRRRSSSRRRRSGDPHARGDGPTGPLYITRAHVRSPRAWGWTVQTQQADQWVTKIPTRVGMDRWPP